MTQVLVVEDDPKIRAQLLFQLREERMAPSALDNAEAALARLEPAAAPLPDLLLVDVRLPQMSGVELVRRLSEIGRLPPTIIVSGEASISETVEALRLGVHDFIEKPFSKERLVRSIRNTLEATHLRREVAELRTELDAGGEILGASPAIATLREQIARAAPTDARVLIRGESGTGKELVANALHRMSRRSERPFIKINCAAIPSQLIEDELFGHKAGAFTDAKNDKPGLFEAADGGTLFLDEIGDMEYELQARLLRVLEDGRVRRVGGAKERAVDVRVLAATHTDLEAAIAEKRFREDLFFRLAHLPLQVPPLREHPEDVRMLLEHFLTSFCRRNRLRRPEIDEAVYGRLERYAWPGNVRELKSLAERLAVFAGDPVTVERLPTPYRDGEPAPASGLLKARAIEPLPLKEFKARVEREYLESVLEKTGWNVAAAARLLGIQRTYLHQKLNALGARRPEGEERREP